MAMEMTWTSQREMSITEHEAYNDAHDALIQAHNDGIAMERIRFIRKRALFFFTEEVRHESIKAAERFERELEKIVKNNLRAIRRNFLSFITRMDIYRTYKDAYVSWRTQARWRGRVQENREKIQAVQWNEVVASHTNRPAHRAN